MANHTEDAHDPDRRYTDQDIALVLQRAVEIEERSDSAASRGVTRRELMEIAQEVGLSPAVIDEAIVALDTGVRTPRRSLLGAPLSNKQVRGVQGHLEQDDLQRLIRLVEERLEATGTVTDALGMVRWTSIRTHKFGSTTQVSLSMQGDETQIQVVERFPAALRGVLHFLPTMWGTMIGGAVAASAGGISTATGVAIAAGVATLGVGIGRTVWQVLARRSAREVQSVATELALAAREMSDR